VIIVVLDEPIGAHQGGAVAAPVFSTIADQILPYLDVMPDNAPSAKAPAGQLAKNFARATLQAVVGASKEHESDTVEAVRLPEVAQSATGGEVREVVYAAAGERALLMPDLRGRSVRDAARVCAQLGLELEASGEGLAVKQSPAVGSQVEAGQTVRIEFGRSD